MTRPYRLMYGLLYPAVLGTVLVGVLSLVSRILEDGALPDRWHGKLILTLGIVVHFMVDYTLGQEAPEHGWRGFAFDCGVLVGLWAAAASVHAPYTGGNDRLAPDVRSVCIALALVYILFLIYLALYYRELKSVPLVAAVEIFSLFWFAVGAVWENLSFAALGLFVSAALLLGVGNKALASIRGTERSARA